MDPIIASYSPFIIVINLFTILQNTLLLNKYKRWTSAPLMVHIYKFYVGLDSYITIQYFTSCSIWHMSHNQLSHVTGFNLYPFNMPIIQLYIKPNQSLSLITDIHHILDYIQSTS